MVVECRKRRIPVARITSLVRGHNDIVEYQNQEENQMPQKRDSASQNAAVSNPVADRLQRSYALLDATGSEYDGIIEQIDIAKAGDIFGEDAKDPDREVVQLTVRVPEHDMSFRKTFSMPSSPASWHHPMFGLAGYVKAYGHTPQIGDAVKVSLTEKGFYEVQLA
jgi:hypothetical protein